MASCLAHTSSAAATRARNSCEQAHVNQLTHHAQHHYRKPCPLPATPPVPLPAARGRIKPGGAGAATQAAQNARSVVLNLYLYLFSEFTDLRLDGVACGACRRFELSDARHHCGSERITGPGFMYSYMNEAGQHATTYVNHEPVAPSRRPLPASRAQHEHHAYITI